MRGHRIARTLGRGTTVARDHALRRWSHAERSGRGARRLARHGQQAGSGASHAAPYHSNARRQRSGGRSNTMTHPSSLDLEAFACGEVSGPSAKVADHLAVCDACAAHVQQLRGLVGPTAAEADAVVARALASVPVEAKVGSAVRAVKEARDADGKSTKVR